MKTTENMTPRPFILILSLLVVAPVLERTAVLAQVSGGWIITSSMNIPRDVHTATLLLNGKVLVVGGFNETERVSSAELYNPTTGMWSITANLNTARFDHTAARLQDGKVLVAGGFTGVSTHGFCPCIDFVTASAELYDPVTARWDVTENLNTARALHTATLLQNGKILVPGGTDGEDEEEEEDEEDEEEEERKSEYVPSPQDATHRKALQDNAQSRRREGTLERCHSVFIDSDHFPADQSISWQLFAGVRDFGEPQGEQIAPARP